VLVHIDKLSEELKKDIMSELADKLNLEKASITLNSLDISIGEPTYKLAEIEKIALIKALSICSGNITKTAVLLGVTRRTVYSLVKKYSIEKIVTTSGK